MGEVLVALSECSESSSAFFSRSSSSAFFLARPVVAKNRGLHLSSTHASQADDAPPMHRDQQRDAVHDASSP